MHIDFLEPGQVQFSMNEYIWELAAECPKDLNRGAAMTLATNHLFQVNPDCLKLNMKDAETFHHLTAKLHYLSKCTHPDLQTAVTFLMTCVKAPDADDYKKLGHCLQYLCDNPDLPLTLGTDGQGVSYTG